MFDMSYFGKFYLVGLDARKAADWLFSADVSRAPGTEPRWATLSHFGAAPGTETRQRANPVLSGLIWLMAPPRGLALGPRVQTPLPSWPSPGPRPLLLPPFLYPLSPPPSSPLPPPPLLLCSRQGSRQQVLRTVSWGCRTCPLPPLGMLSPSRVSRIKQKHRVFSAI